MSLQCGEESLIVLGILYEHFYQDWVGLVSVGLYLSLSNYDEVNAIVDVENSVPITLPPDDDEIIEHFLGREKPDDEEEGVGEDEDSTPNTWKEADDG
ncbi:hypothetical protein AVEN_171211-1 [Araneus ventricosus]|uniref:Uncharacterized protein n=1 Tax=Araneus ventricosus TaxID=182803 RepID=A0A4Y2HG89_ARAVE|nr:hypothetical protein AVEN_171211-1 [Araneus ventricosus]